MFIELHDLGAEMAKPRSKLISIVAIVVVVAASCWCGVVRLNLLAPFGACFAPSDQATMIDMFENDPLFAVAPDGGRLVKEKATSYECDNGHGGSPWDPEFAEVVRLYKTPDVYRAAQIHQMFDRTAIAAGWIIVAQSDDRPDYANVRYCKQFGERVADGWVQSRNSSGPEVDVTLDARVDGSTCGMPVGS